MFTDLITSSIRLQTQPVTPASELLVMYSTYSRTYSRVLVDCRATSHYCEIINNEAMFIKFDDNVDAEKRDCIGR